MNYFKAYDIRGRVSEDLNEDIAYRIGRACAAYALMQQKIAEILSIIDRVDS